MLPGRGCLNAAPGPFSHANMSFRSFVAGAGVEEKARRWLWHFRRVEEEEDGYRERVLGWERKGCDDDADEEVDNDEDEAGV